MLQCYSLKSSRHCLLPQSPKVCSLHLCLFCGLAYRVAITIFLTSIYTRVFIYCIGVSQKEKHHSSILAWRIPWTEDPGGLKSRGLHRVGHDWATDTFTFHFHYTEPYSRSRASWVVQLVKNPPAMQEIPVWFWVRKFPQRRDKLLTPVSLGFPGGSDSKESTCNAG